MNTVRQAEEFEVGSLQILNLTPYTTGPRRLPTLMHVGGSVAKLSACRTPDPAVPGLSPARTWIYLSAAPNSNPRPC